MPKSSKSMIVTDHDGQVGDFDHMKHAARMAAANAAYAKSISSGPSSRRSSISDYP